MNIISKQIKDWNTKENGNPDIYDLKIELLESSVSVITKNKETGLFMEAIIEIHNGIPAVHVYGQEGGDPIVHAHRNTDGLVINPERYSEMQTIVDPIYPVSTPEPALFFGDPHVCEYCGQDCFTGEGCDEHLAGGFQNES